MKNTPRSVLVLLIIALIAACDKSAPKQRRVTRSQVATETIKLVFPPEVSNVFSNAVEAFHKLDSRLPNGLKVTFEREILPSMEAAQKIANGEMKATMWVAPSPTLIEYVNSHLVNLGAKQIECKKIFSTGLVAAASRGNRKKLAGIAPSIESSQVFSDKVPHQLNFNFPSASDGGLAASLYVSFVTSKNATDVSSYRLFPGTRQLLSALSKPYFGVPRMALVTEQEVLSYNRQMPLENRVNAIYLSSRPLELEYNLCISDADWVAPSERAAALFFQPHLLSPEVQRFAQEEGFRVIEDQGGSENIFTKELGVLPSPPTPFVNIPSSLFTEVRKDPRSLNPLTATMYVLDCSSSMQGPAFISAKRLLRGTFERENPENPSGLIGFDSTVELVSPPTTQKRDIYPHLTGLAINAGSSVYDAILLAAEQLGKEEFRTYQRRIVLITDGNDQNSQTTLPYFGSTLQRKMNNREVSLITLVVPQPEAVHTDLEEITNIVSGSMVSYNSNFSLEEFMQTIDRS